MVPLYIVDNREHPHIVLSRVADGLTRTCGFYDRYDTEGGVSYRELLLFCARHAGKWSDAQPGLAERLRQALRNQVGDTTTPCIVLVFVLLLSSAAFGLSVVFHQSK